MTRSNFATHPTIRIGGSGGIRHVRQKDHAARTRNVIARAVRAMNENPENAPSTHERGIDQIAAGRCKCVGARANRELPPLYLLRFWREVGGHSEAIDVLLGVKCDACVLQ